MKINKLFLLINGLIFSIEGYAGITDYTGSTTLSNGYTTTNMALSVSNGAAVDIASNGSISIENQDVGNFADIIKVQNGSFNLGTGSTLTATILDTTPASLDNRTAGLYLTTNNVAGVKSKAEANNLIIEMDGNSNTNRTAATYGIYTDNNSTGTVEYDLKGITRINVNNTNSFAGNAGQANGIGLTNGANGNTNFKAEGLEININDNHNSGNYVGMKFKNNTSADANQLAVTYENAIITINAEQAMTNVLGLFIRNAEITGVDNTTMTISSQEGIATSTPGGTSEDAGVHGIKINNGGKFQGNETQITFNSEKNIGSSDSRVFGINVDGHSSYQSNISSRVTMTSNESITAATAHYVAGGSSSNTFNTQLAIMARDVITSATGLDVTGAGSAVNSRGTQIDITGNTGAGAATNSTITGVSVTDSAAVTLNEIAIITLTPNADNASIKGITVEGTDSSLSHNAPSSSMLITLDTNNRNTNDIVGINISASASNAAVKNLNLNLNKLEITSANANTSTTGSYINVTDGISEIKTNELYLGTPGINHISAINSTGGSITLNSNNLSYINGAINARNTGVIDLTLKTNTAMLSDITAFDNAKINLNLQAGDWMGKAQSSSDNEINATLANNLTWTMTGSSTITSLDLSDSTITYQPIADSILTTRNLTSTNGGGRFNMHVDMGAQTGDKLIVGDINNPLISGSSSDAYNLNITNNGTASTNGTEVYNVVEDYSPTASANATFTSNTVEQGGFEYGLHTTTMANGAKAHQLRANQHKTSTANASISFLNTGYLLSYIDLQTLFQRMGELRSEKGQEGNFWLRSFGGKLNSFSTSHGLDGFHMNYTGLQAGIDKLIPIDSGNIYLGVMAGYTDADPRYKDGSGGVRDINFGLYGTYINNNGFYVDTVAKYIRLKNNFSVTDTQGQSVKGRGKTDGYSLSLETGKRFNINQSNFYIEPQAQVVYSRQNGDNIQASNGLNVKLDSYDSLLGAGRVAFGYNILNGNTPTNIHIKSGYVKEFKGNTAYHLNEYEEKYKFRGGWVETSIGISTEIGKRHNIYGELSYANGNRFDKRQFNLGYRYQF